MKFLRSFGI